MQCNQKSKFAESFNSNIFNGKTNATNKSPNNQNLESTSTSPKIEKGEKIGEGAIQIIRVGQFWTLALPLVSIYTIFPVFFNLFVVTEPKTPS
jgi:hypothetical protein